jgi:hypothetical protein
VQTGRVVGDHIEILSGIKPDDQLVASGGSFLSDGDLVRVVDAPASGTGLAMQDAKKNSAPAQVKPASAASK